MDSMRSAGVRPRGGAGRTGGARPGRVGASLLLAALVGAAVPVAGQERERERCVCVETIAPFSFSFGRARLGVLLQMEADAATDSIGARIVEVAPGSPAAEAGLRAGDIVTAINGRSVLEPVAGEVVRSGRSAPAQRVMLLMRDVDPGDTVRVDYRRGSERRSARVATRRDDDWIVGFDGRWPRVRVEPPRAVVPRRLDGPEGVLEVAARTSVERRYGFEAVDLNAELGEYFGATEGALVTRVRENAPLALRPGDVVVRVAGRAVRDADHLRDILASYRRDEPLTLEVLRKRTRVTVEGRAR